MELTWPVKLRIALVAAVGVVVIGVYAWPFASPVEPFGVISIVNGIISYRDAFILLAIAFGVGLVSYFLAWPYGYEIGVLAVPAGLAVWAMRSGDMGTLMQLNPSIAGREQIFSAMRWEPIFWLAIVAAGFLGVLLASRIHHHGQDDVTSQKSKRTAGDYINWAVAVVGSVIVTQFFIGIFARDFSFSNAAIGSAVAQPAAAQIAFAVFVSFILAGFLGKKFLDVGYVWSVIASCWVTLFAVSVYGRHDIIEYFAGHWPAVFFPNSVLAVLPIQVVAFGSLGSVAGYWLAIRYDYWHRCELE